MGDDAAVTVTLDSDTANKLSIKVLQKYLGILGNGAVSYQEDGTEKYITPELNMLDKEMKKLFGIDVIDDLGDAVSSDDKDTLYKDTMKFFEKLYGESSESSDSADGSENVTTDESATDEVGDESYDETIDEESYEE